MKKNYYQDLSVSVFNSLEGYLPISNITLINEYVNSSHFINFENIPDKQHNDVRAVSYNIVADFFDKNDHTCDMRHHWVNRAPFIKQLLMQVNSDFICLQELSASQAFELVIALGKNYISAFLSQTPSEIEPTGAIVYGEEVAKWIGKFAGTPLIGTFVSSKNWHFAEEVVQGIKHLQVNRFWLNEKPFEIPQNKDRGETDKGFGNMNTYRAVLWTKLENETGQVLYVFNSHYPLDGSSKVGLGCAQLEMELIQKIAKGKPWISAGDRNLFSRQKDNDIYNIKTVYKEFVKFGYDVRDATKHYGINSTWLGFNYDKSRPDITSLDPEYALDIIVSSKVATRSFCHPGVFNPKTKKLIDLSDYDDTTIAQQNEDRYFASDHAMLGGDFNFYPDGEIL